MSENINQRWYDKDPTVSLAVSFLRNLDSGQQSEIAKKMIEKGKALNIEIEETRIVFHRRWYDENEDLSLAMHYLERANEEHQKLIALDIIELLTGIK